MEESHRTYRVMISGGGTGGHIYPAISIAQALKVLHSDVEILFVGALGKMEMKKVPEAGFEIVGLWISGLQRSTSLKNLIFPIKLLWSLIKSFQLIRSFKPDVVVGVGGYASGPLLYMATLNKIPTLIQEQNSYAGLTNKWLSKSVSTICVAYEKMDKFFPKDKIVFTGNPVRKDIFYDPSQASKAYAFFKLDPNKKTLLVIGGSLGAKTVNESILLGLEQLWSADIQLIWQTGRFYYTQIIAEMKKPWDERLRMYDFIKEMQYAYTIADAVVSRAGALSISELMLSEKPSILIPSPNVAENHQTLNAQNLISSGAALMVSDAMAGKTLIKTVLSLLSDEEKQKELRENISVMGRPNAATDIAKKVIELAA
ncbi:MAG: undecaprenyldiphospho-muramoylpentapeptide beta-N-acetylglucosaminyltransferase [Flammeovirgaceae bacterium]|nr:undecaprenyldiphospho-muramoylpentapeptide beta-N-acetylglucosaminyltransferase [Flammeovirgaceae bacterium]